MFWIVNDVGGLDGFKKFQIFCLPFLNPVVLWVQFVTEKSNQEGGLQMAKTKRETIINSLVDNYDCVEVPSKSGKYRQFKRAGVEDSYIFVGKSGAVRVGRIASKSQSITRSKWVVEHLLENWKK
jgi:hypothetical protein